jgi:hypothetical protein
VAEQWRNGRLVDPDLSEEICVHLVGLTPGLWCGACNTHPEHPDRSAGIPPAPPALPEDWDRRHRVVPPLAGPLPGVTYRCVRCDREAVGAFPSGECPGSTSLAPDAEIPPEPDAEMLRDYFVIQGRGTMLLRGVDQRLGRLVKRWEPDDPLTLADLVERALSDHKEHP